MNFNDYLIIVVVGLSHSGKTTLCKNSISTHILYDDFIPSFYEGKIMNDIKDKKKIVLNDPRLCNYKTFRLFMEIFEKYTKKKDILVILFENDTESCIRNIDIEQNLNVENNILFNSRNYHIKNYINYNNIILPVFRKNVFR
jgi:GTPase SAR1 family protein